MLPDTYNTNDIINTSYDNVKALSERLKDFDVMHQTLKAIVDENTQIPIYFRKIVNEVNDSTKEYLEGHKTLLEETIEEFNKQSQILEKDIITLKGEIERLKSVDLEEHFEKHQKSLSDIFGAINLINLTLTGLTSSLNTINQTLGETQKIINVNSKETNKLITTLSTETGIHLDQQDKKNELEFETLNKEITKISAQNNSLKKEIKTNRIVQISGIAVTILLLIYIIFK